MLDIYASVSGVFIRMLQGFHPDVCICLQWVHMCFKFFLVFCKCFRRMLQVFHLFSDICCKCFIWMLRKSRSGVAHVTMRVRRGEGASSPCERSGGAGPSWACKMQAWVGGVLARAQETEWSAGVHPDVWALALPV
jgi:hypothetical protein